MSPDEAICVIAALQLLALVSEHDEPKRITTYVLAEIDEQKCSS